MLRFDGFYSVELNDKVLLLKDFRGMDKQPLSCKKSRLVISLREGAYCMCPNNYFSFLFFLFHTGVSSQVTFLKLYFFSRLPVGHFVSVIVCDYLY